LLRPFTFLPKLSCKGYRVPPNEPIICRKPSSGGSKTPVRSAEEIYLGNFFRRQNASAERIHRSIPLMGRGELGWEEGVEEIISQHAMISRTHGVSVTGAGLREPLLLLGIGDFKFFDRRSSITKPHSALH
jgi:hypothetical protein